VPEHLNWHVDLAEYIGAKTRLFAAQTPDDITIYFDGNETSRLIAAASSGQQIPFYTSPGAYIDNSAISISGQEICRTDELKLLGEHNWQNACAAVTAVWQVMQDVAAIRSVLTSFSGLEHRLEFVRELNNVRYYDDSFGTTPETAIVAIKAFDEPKVIILGGSDKGASYDELAQTVASSSIRKVLLIGDQAPRLQEALDRAGFSNYMPGGNSMAEIVNNARQEAAPGDIVLLSTGCASFGMFKDYKDRGNQFKSSVQSLV
jgi:UDP-N-acetylmuramoylalanine--D-glutamate ligase